MDRSRQTYSALDEVRQIREEAHRSTSLQDLRHCYERVQSLRRTHIDDFDLQLSLSELQEEIIEAGRQFRGESAPLPEHGAGGDKRSNPPHTEAIEPKYGIETAPIPPDVQKVDEKTWQRATYLALFFTLLICAGFFYLIQTARRINMPSAETPASKAPEAAPAKGTAQPAPLSSASAAASTAPTLRLYTDLIPGTVSVDDAPPSDLKDGELVLDHLKPGRHSIKVVGRNGNTGFSFDVSEKEAPRVVGLPAASNAMAVLVAVQGDKGRLITNADQSTVSLDGKEIGQVGPDGLDLNSLGKVDHDLQVIQQKDRQRFVLTYTTAPTLTAYVKSDPNAGTVVVVAGQDGADVFVNDLPYRRKTDRGPLRIPLKVGQYTIRIHKPGFIDPPSQTVSVKKAEETAVEFRLDPLPQIATLQIRGALPGTMVYLDKDVAAVIAADGNADISNVKPGDHTIELRRDQALPKKFERTFNIGDVVQLSGSDVTLERVVSENKPAPPAPMNQPSAANGTPAAANYGMQMEGEQVRKGGGFVPYHTPKVSGRYFFQAQGRIGGILKHSKLQWYAGYQDSQNYVLFVVDGKHATIRDIRDGKATDVSRIPFNADSSEWVQVNLTVKPDSIDAKVKTTDTEWQALGSVSSDGRDFTQGKVGFYIPGNDEIAVSNFRFSNH